MSNPASETFGQARQGSVAAIIQIMNERLADSGIRTRAVIAEGMLQVLCEAPSTEQLDKTTVVDRVRQILENISPQRIKRVNINSRIVKEEQLLWLEEINRDPENALLWSEVITLKRPFFIKRWIRDRNLKPAGPILKDISAPEPSAGNLTNKIIGGAGLLLLLLGTGWLFREDISQVNSPSDSEPAATAANSLTTADGLPPLPTETESANADGAAIDDPGNRTADTTPQLNPLATQPTATPSDEQASQASGDDTSASSAATAANTEANNAAGATVGSADASTDATQPAATPSSNNAGQVADAFAEAVRIANQAVTDGQSATTATDWLDLATRWQRASDLMAQVPVGSEQYNLAVERVQTYADNSQTAIQRAASLQE
ncbi:MAG: hypothetical protein AAFU53_01170 [Cyanobacteria bacterium J06632_3]